MSKLKFPEIVEAVRSGDKVQWKVGDLLLKRCGEPEEETYHDGSYAMLEEVTKELVEIGYDQYTTRYLAQLRAIAYVYPIRGRSSDIAWTLHRDAGSSEMLTEIIKRTKGEKLTQDLVRETKQEIEEEREHERKDALKDAEKEEEAAKKDAQRAREERQRAKDEEAKKKAEKNLEEAERRRNEAVEKAKKNKIPPKKSGKKKAGPAPRAAIQFKILAKVAEAKVLAKDTCKLFEGREAELSPAAIAAIAEEMLGAANLWREAADKIRKCEPNKRSHLAVVK